MPSAPHLYVCLSYHGFGHIAQIAPVVSYLRQTLPELRLTLHSEAPKSLLQNWFAAPFGLVPRATDPGMLMDNALDVRAQASFEAYRTLHQHWEQEVADWQAHLRRHQPTLVLSNIAYLPLVAARRLGIPAVALCSLNWADILAGYCTNAPEGLALLEAMRDGYRQADLFIQPIPHMPMDWLNRGKSDDIRVQVGPIARTGVNRRPELEQAGLVQPGQRLVLVSMGGMPLALDFESWPASPGIRWLSHQPPQERADFLMLDRERFPYIDWFASCDAVVTKPGYGTVAEAVCNAVPLVYVRRQDWPEEPYLLDWLHRQLPAQALARSEIASRALLDALGRLWNEPMPGDVAGSRTAAAGMPAAGTPAAGICQAAEILRRYL